MNLTIINRRGATSDPGLLMKKILIAATTLVCLWGVQPAQANEQKCFPSSMAYPECGSYCSKAGGILSVTTQSKQCPVTNPDGHKVYLDLCVCKK
jgi:putative hemolysin